MRTNELRLSRLWKHSRGRRHLGRQEGRIEIRLTVEVAELVNIAESGIRLLQIIALPWVNVGWVRVGGVSHSSLLVSGCTQMRQPSRDIEAAVNIQQHTPISQRLLESLRGLHPILVYFAQSANCSQHLVNTPRYPKSCGETKRYRL